MLFSLSLLFGASTLQAAAAQGLPIPAFYGLQTAPQPTSFAPFTGFLNPQPGSSLTALNSYYLGNVGQSAAQFNQNLQTVLGSTFLNSSPAGPSVADLETIVQAFEVFKSTLRGLGLSKTAIFEILDQVRQHSGVLNLSANPAFQEFQRRSKASESFLKLFEVLKGADANLGLGEVAGAPIAAPEVKLPEPKTNDVAGFLAPEFKAGLDAYVGAKGDKFTTEEAKAVNAFVKAWDALKKAKDALEASPADVTAKLAVRVAFDDAKAALEVAKASKEEKSDVEDEDEGSDTSKKKTEASGLSQRALRKLEAAKKRRQGRK